MNETKKCPDCGMPFKPGTLQDHEINRAWLTYPPHNPGGLECLRRQLSAAQAELEQAQAACAGLPSLVRRICKERRNDCCWYEDGDCGNWKECSDDCPLATLRAQAGFVWQNDNGDLGPTPSDPGQAILDEFTMLREIVGKLPKYADTGEVFIPGLDEAWIVSRRSGHSVRGVTRAACLSSGWHFESLEAICDCDPEATVHDADYAYSTADRAAIAKGAKP